MFITTRSFFRRFYSELLNDLLKLMNRVGSNVRSKVMIRFGIQSSDSNKDVLNFKEIMIAAVIKSVWSKSFQKIDILF